MFEQEKQKPERIKLVISDFHIGEGHKLGKYNVYDEFHLDEEFYEFMSHYSSGIYEHMDIELIINGDFFDFLSVKYNGEFTDIITPTVSMSKLRKCVEGHPLVIEAIKLFLSRKRHQITYLIGNHDSDFAFLELQDLIREYLLLSEDYQYKFRFVTDRDYYVLGREILIEHGHQFEAANFKNYSNLILKKRLPEPILNLAWGDLFVLHVLNPLKKKRPHIDQVKPFWTLLFLSLISDPIFAVTAIFRTVFYFIKTKMFKSSKAGGGLRNILTIIFRSVSVHPSLDKQAVKLLKQNNELKAVMLGHSHEFRYISFDDDKIYINTGTWIKTVSLSFKDFGQRSRLTYAQVAYHKDNISDINLLEWLGTRKMIRKVTF